MEQLTKELQKVVDFLSGELAQIRTGRANPALVEDIAVDAYGTPTPIKQVGQVSVPEATVITVTPYDKSLLKPIEDALKTAGVGQVGSDSNAVRVSLPPMTEERRTEFAKVVGEKLEQAKVSLRNARRDAIEADEKEDLSDDELKRSKEAIDAEISKFQKKLDELADAKREEIATV
jgi:ribosome recycling factor